MKIEGIITAMITPFNKNEEIDLDASKILVERLIAKGVHGIFVLGTNGEFYNLSHKEKVDYTKSIVDIVGGRVPVYAGAGLCSTKNTIALARDMKDAGADAVSVITPYFQKLTQSEMEYHYQAVAEQVDIPVLMYNIPSLTQNTISPEIVAKLCKLKNIAGVKDSGGNIEVTKAYLEASKGEDFVVLQGSDSLILSGLQLGAGGAISATSNLITETIVSIYNNFMNGDIEKAQKAQDSIEKLRTVLKRGAQPSVVKRALVLSNVPVGSTKAPIAPITEEIDEEIKEMLEFYGEEITR